MDICFIDFLQSNLENCNGAGSAATLRYCTSQMSSSSSFTSRHLLLHPHFFHISSSATTMMDRREPISKLLSSK
ncbi:unnamed protein product [Onchocerca flexuosa]|uniref:Ovule protein n=1 Tax=Onchocerca flexuosa TaxID=387005 RepID=A0A183GZY8_9BILA|nr:unnamed protein product [Onchocerca flexuosa]